MTFTHFYVKQIGDRFQFTNQPRFYIYVYVNCEVFILASMESQLSCVVVLSGKSTSEKEEVKSLKENSSLKLADDAKLLTLLQSEINRQSEEKDEFDIDAYMASLMTSCFGRFLLWSPRLPSTQDVVSL